MARRAPYPTRQQAGSRTTRTVPEVGRPLALLSIVLTGAIASGVSAGESAQRDDDRCLDCHAQAHIATVPAEDRHTMVAPSPEFPLREHPESLVVDETVLGRSAHAAVGCEECHRGAKTLPHPARLPEVVCAPCHEDQAAAVARSRHAQVAMRSEPPAPGCADCHGSHDILPPEDRNSRVYPLEVIKTCAACHRQHSSEITGREPGEVLVASYLESIHGRTIARAGLVVGATCAECHGHHEVLPSLDPRSRVHRSNIPQTCGHCHVGIQEQFEETVHAEVAREQSRSRQPPVCSDCHTSHQITQADAPTFVRDIVSECGSCHEALYRTYRESYHGQVQRLGSARAARCSDCHGTHDIRRPEDPASTLAPARRVETCGRCHEDLAALPHSARDSFVEYLPHADLHDRKKNPALFWIWRGSATLGVAATVLWGLHWTLWCVPSLRWRFRRKRVARAQAEPMCIRRFSVSQRVTHLIVVVSFLGLALSGLPLKFAGTPWATTLAEIFGGADRAGAFHRLFAVLLGAGVLAHVLELGICRWRVRTSPERIARGRGMLPGVRDWQHVIRTLRWCVGRGPRPRLGRWSYWEKFDYWVAVGCVIALGGSGLVLWFPEVFVRYASGAWINVAAVLHGYAALLVVAFFFVVHVVSAGLRWGKFPINLAIFTGRVPEDDYRSERRAEYERLVNEGELDRVRVRPVSAPVRTLASVVATIAVALCLLLAFLIAVAIV